MATTFAYTLPDFQPLTKIVSADMNSKLTNIKNRFNWDGTAATGLGDDNVQSNTVSGGGLTRATKLKAGTANYVLINDSDGKMSEEASLAASRGGLGFAPSFSGNAGRAVVVNSAETGFELGSPTQSTLTQSLSGDVSDITAGEAISARDAVCLGTARDASNNVIYRVFKCDSDLPNRRFNYLGMATAAATVVAHTLTWTDSAALVASNSITWSINGRAYTQAFDTDNDTTLAAIAVQINADTEIQSASVVDAGSNDRVINITGKGGLRINITGATVTGGASQATITIATVQAPSGQNVMVRTHGPLTGFSGLTTTGQYYLSGTAGAITTTPTDPAPIFVGQALSSTVLFVNKNPANYQFQTSQIFVRSHGSSTNALSGGQLDVEHYNFISWSAGTSDINVKSAANGSDAAYGAYHIYVDGADASSTFALLTRLYNKASWSSASNRANNRASTSGGVLSNTFYVAAGRDNAAAAANIDGFNGSTWTSGIANVNTAGSVMAAFAYSSTLRFIAGRDFASGGLNAHNVFNGASNTTSTVSPVSTGLGSGAVAPGSLGLIWGVDGASTASYSWNGSWSASITASHSTLSTSGTLNFGATGGWSQSTNYTLSNGGTNGASARADSMQFNGLSWATTTSSSIARAGASGGVF